MDNNTNNTLFQKYTKRPVEVAAVQWTGGDDQAREIVELIQADGGDAWLGALRSQGGVEEIWIRTLEGVMQAPVGSYIIRGVEGEFYACRPDIFEKTYNAVGDD